MSEGSPGEEGGATGLLDLRAALHLTLIAWLVNLLVFALLLGWASFPVALAVGSVVGFGGIGTLAARQVPPPTEQRLGLGPLPLDFVPTLLLLLPAVILASEIDNLAALLLPRAQPGEGESPPEVPAELMWIEVVIAGVLLRPVVEEFFFRGVLQQGLIACYGQRGGLLRTAGLFTLVQASLGLAIGPSYAVSLGLQGFFVGLLLGLVRLASASLLAPIALQIAMNAMGTLALAFQESWPIPGFNAPGDSTPAAYLLPSTLAVALGVRRALGRIPRDEVGPASTPPAP